MDAAAAEIAAAEPAEEAFDATPATPAVAYTREILMQMRKVGLPQPSEVTDSDWEAATPAELISPTARVKMHMQKLQDAIGDKSVFGVTFAPAVEVLMHVMTDINEHGRTRAGIAQFLIEQAVGKAGQEIKHTGNIVHDWRRMADEIEASYKAIPQLSAESTTANPIDPIDATVDAFLNAEVATDFSVGKRALVVEEDESEQAGE